MKTDDLQTAPLKVTAFTLIELLVVMTIILILLALVVPPASHVLDSIAVTSAGESIQSQLALDRQLALTRNRAIEIRFYEVPESTAAGQNRFTTYGSWMYDANGINPKQLDKLTKLPNGVIIDALPSSGGTATICSSTLVDSAPHKGVQKIPSIGTSDYNYRAFRFTPNGATDLSLGGTANSDTWFLTTRRVVDPATSSTPARNFYVLQVDPLTGQTKTFRP